MDICINRNMMKKNLHYSVEHYNITGSANYTWGILPVKIEVLSNKNHIMLKQSPWILKFINSLPLLNYETFTPFKLYKNGAKCGRGWHILFRPVFVFIIENDRYELRHHTDNYISIMKDNKQIGLVRKKIKTIAEKNTYYVKCINEENILDIIMLFCVFIDVMFYPNNKQISYVKTEKTFVLNDKFSKRINWNPMMGHQR